jgi:ABC-type multidrug transport system ATPase subunit
MVSLGREGKNIVKGFSGGMKRRLSLAIAAVGDPQIILLDEPTTGLDPKVRQQVWALIERLKKGRSIILTTHSME